MFRAAKISSSSFKLPAKPLTRVELRLDLAVLEDVFWGTMVHSSVLLEEYDSFPKVYNGSLEGLWRHRCA
jgi:hypothetical protein